jgi:RNA polymerase sigma-70 factor (ECF subfamily)
VTAIGYAESVTDGHAQADLAKSAEEARPLVTALMAERDPFLAFVRGRVRSGADAEDILQQAFVKAAEHERDVRDLGRARAWFFQILRRTLADHHAQWALREAKLHTLAADMEEATPEEVASCACSLGQLERIRPEYADILRRVDIDEQPLAEVADALGVTVNNATVRLHRARKALRQQLVAFCGTESAKACLDCGCD